MKRLHKIVFIAFTTIFLGCEEIFFEQDISEETITIYAPRNGVTVDTSSVIFSWSEVEDAESYEFQIVQPDFQTAITIIESVSIETNEHTITDLDIGSYEWRVRAVNSNSETSYIHALLTVTENENFSERTVTLVSPENDFVTNELTLDFEWESVTDATSYTIELLDDSSNVLNTETITSTLTNITFTENVTSWQVRAENTDGETTAYSNNSILIDTEAPNTPTLTLPSNNSVTSAITTFEWTREAIAGSEETDVLYIYTDVTLNTLYLEETEASSGMELTIPIGTYYWNVQSFDEAGNESGISETFTFTVN